jgi:hypothetical protein
VLGWIMALPQEVTSRHPFLFVLHQYLRQLCSLVRGIRRMNPAQARHLAIDAHN